MSVQKSSVHSGPLTEATTPPMYVMVDMSRFTVESIGGGFSARLSITHLPYCWHICEKIDPEWAVVLTLSHGQDGSTHYELALATQGGELVHCGTGGGPSKDCAKHLTQQINELLDQFLKVEGGAVGKPLT